MSTTSARPIVRRRRPAPRSKLIQAVAPVRAPAALKAEAPLKAAVCAVTPVEGATAGNGRAGRNAVAPCKAVARAALPVEGAAPTRAVASAGAAIPRTAPTSDKVESSLRVPSDVDVVGPDGGRSGQADIEDPAGTAPPPSLIELQAALVMNDEARTRPFMPPLTEAAPTLADQRGYSREHLWVLADMGYHYLRCGGFRLAAALFQGLAAIDPTEPYYAMALGLAADRLGQPLDADAWYRKAGKLDPGDPRPDVNRAELASERGDLALAVALLKQALAKSRSRADLALERKARALLDLTARVPIPDARLTTARPGLPIPYGRPPAARPKDQP